MTYYPYLRGKQFELLALRDMSDVIASAKFVPIIEPVRESLKGLERAVEALNTAGAETIIITNPQYGFHSTDSDEMTGIFHDAHLDQSKIIAGIYLNEEMEPNTAISLIEKYKNRKIALIHAGISDPSTIASHIGNLDTEFTHVFLDSHASALYRRRFSDGVRVLIHDGFNRQKNADYGDFDHFSELHVTYLDMGLQGFGDFLTVGDYFSEGGGPAYAVAIHLTFIDPSEEYDMFVRHFKSITNDTPTDPAGKFAQALHTLITALNSPDNKIRETSAVAELRDLATRQHFPGLGYIKKLSMNHHVQTLADFQAGEI